jgi:hypothetical protein
MNTPAPAALARFQEAFAKALLDPDAAPDTEVAALAARPAFAVYRNTVMKGWIDALRANFPAVARIVGDEWFRAAAATYARAAPPSDPTLLRFGASFPEFLGSFDPAAGLPYLPAVARLDRFWTDAHAAPDGDVLDPASVAGLAPGALARAVLHPHPAARWAWFADAPIHTIWSRNRSDEPWDGELDWRAEGALITRPLDAVASAGIGAPECAFLDACAAGGTLDAATRAALDAQGDADLAQLMSTLLTAGAFSRMSFMHETPGRERS